MTAEPLDKCSQNIKFFRIYYSLSILSAIFQVDRGSPVPECLPFSDFIGAKVDGGGGKNWSYKTCRAPVRMSSPANQQPAVLHMLEDLPVVQPTVSKHWREIYYV